MGLSINDVTLRGGEGVDHFVTRGREGSKNEPKKCDVIFERPPTERARLPSPRHEIIGFQASVASTAAHCQWAE